MRNLGKKKTIRVLAVLLIFTFAGQSVAIGQGSGPPYGPQPVGPGWGPQFEPPGAAPPSPGTGPVPGTFPPMTGPVPEVYGPPSPPTGPPPITIPPEIIPAIIAEEEAAPEEGAAGPAGWVVAALVIGGIVIYILTHQPKANAKSQQGGTCPNCTPGCP